MDQKLSNSIVAKSNGILQLFIGFVQTNNLHEVKECSEEDGIALLNWLSSNKVDYLDDANRCDTIDAKLIPQLSSDTSENDFLSWILELKSMLPILLKCNGDVEFVDENGKTILHIFLEDSLCNVSKKRSALRIYQMVECLIASGISVEAVDKNGNTPLHTAAKLAKIDLVQAMLKNCVDMNACNNQGDTVLHILCSEISLWPSFTSVGHDLPFGTINIFKTFEYDPTKCAQLVELAQLMLFKGADVNIQNNTGWTPVHFTAKYHFLDMLKVFVKAGANLNLLTNDGENPLLIFCKYADIHIDHQPGVLAELVELLINKGSNVNVTDRDGSSPLHYTCHHRHVPKMLIQAGADVHCRTKTFLLTPLHCAAYGGTEFELKTLVEAGADVNARTVDGVSPLHLVVLSGAMLNAVEYLIQEGATSCRENIFGFGLLHMAAIRCDSSRLDHFSRRRLKVNDGGDFGITPLHLASFRGDVKSVKVLISRGADVHCRDAVTNSTALHFVAKGGDILDWISHICEADCQPCWKPPVYFYNDDEGVMALLVNEGVDVNSKDVHGQTPLHLATIYAESEEISYQPWATRLAERSEKIDPVRGLLNCGADLDVQDDEGNLPVHNALRTGHEKALKSLLEFGVNVNDDDTSCIVLSCEEDMRNLVLKYYLVKLKVAGLPVSGVYDLSTNDLENQSFYNKCLDEDERMSKTVLIDSTTSIYNLLHMDWRRRLNFVQKLPKNLKNKFPLYAGIVQASCREAVQRKSLLEPAKLGWYRITEIDLPDICVERILHHLKNRYLRVLAEGMLSDSVQSDV